MSDIVINVTPARFHAAKCEELRRACHWLGADVPRCICEEVSIVQEYRRHKKTLKLRRLKNENKDRRGQK